MSDKFAVHLSSLAEKDLNLIIDDIVETYDEYAASIVYEKIAQAISSLGIFPEKWSKVSQEPLFSLGYRRARAGKYIVIYKIDYKNKIVRIELIVHSHRDIGAVYSRRTRKRAKR